MGRQLTSLFTLAFCALVTSCGAGAPGLDSGEASVGEGLTLQGVERCSAGRFESTVATACTGTLRRVDAAPVDASLAPLLDSDDLYGVRLPANGSAFAGAVRLKPSTGGEYIVYLGTPNIELSIEDAAGASVAPSCGSHLPTVAPNGYPADCTLRGAYALNLRAGETYTLRFGPAASHYVRVSVQQRRRAGVTLSAPACDAGALSSTLANACALAEPSTPITAAAPGNTNKQVTVGTTQGVRLSAAGAGFEGTVMFTPPYTADYLVYSGTPNLGVSLVGATVAAAANVCAAKVDDVACPLWKAAFRYQRLEGGVPLQLEFGPTTASWVRTLVLPVQPDSDTDGLADNYDQCPSESFPGTACGCAVEVCAGGIVWSDVFDGYPGNVAVDSTDHVVTAGTAVSGIDIRKYDAGGTLTWARTLTPPSWNGGFGNELDTDADGNLIVGGSYENSSTGDNDVYVAKLDPAGNLVWDDSFSNGEDEFDGRIAVDGSGNVFSLTTYSELRDEYFYEAVLRKFAPDGAPLWTRRYTGKGVAQATLLTVDASGAALVTGLTRTAAFGGTQTTFVAKFNAAGELIWEKEAAVSGIASTAGGGIVTHNPSALSLFDSALAPVWSTAGYTSNLSSRLAVDGLGNLAVTGWVLDGTKTSLVVRKFNASGAFLWERAYQRNSPDSRSQGVDVAFASDGSPIVVGSLFTPAGGRKGLLVKYQP